MEKLFGENLAAIRIEKGLSQSALAENLHVSRQAVSNWERGKSYPDLETLSLIASALGVSASELLQEKAGDGLSISPWFLAFNIAGAVVHFVLGLCGWVNVMAVTALPWLAAFMMLIVALSFRAMFKSGNYDILAGFNAKKDSVPQTRKQMYWLHLLVGIASSLYQLMFIMVYFLPAEKQMDVTSVLVVSYIGVFLATALAVNFKIKTR